MVKISRTSFSVSLEFGFMDRVAVSHFHQDSSRFAQTQMSGGDQISDYF